MRNGWGRGSRGSGRPTRTQMWRRQHEGKESYETWERAARMRDLKQYGDTTGGTWDAYPCRWGERAEWGPAAGELHWHIGRKGTWTG